MIPAKPCAPIFYITILKKGTGADESGSLPMRIARSWPSFDGWVDHAASRMDITENGKVVEPLVPTLDSEPDVLAASASELAPGRYQLHWHAKSIPDGDFSDGFIPFTVAR